MKKYTHSGKSLSSAAGRQGEVRPSFAPYNRPPPIHVPRFWLPKGPAPSGVRETSQDVKDEGRIPSTLLTTVAQLRNLKFLNGFPEFIIFRIDPASLAIVCSFCLDMKNINTSMCEPESFCYRILSSFMNSVKTITWVLGW